MQGEPPAGPTHLKPIARNLRQMCRPGARGGRAWKGASIGVAAASLLMLLWVSHSLFAAAGPLYFVAGFLLFVLLGLAAAGIAVVLLATLNRLPRGYQFWLVVGVLALALPLINVPLRGVALLVAAVLLLSSIAGAALWAWLDPRRKPSRAAPLVLALSSGGLLAGAVWLFQVNTHRPAQSQFQQQPSILETALPNPALPGVREVLSLTYGSGADRHRPEYGTQAMLLTEPIDGRSFVSDWSALRTQFWGFNQRAMPLNGRVWYPAGDDTAPLILMVHGNHDMADFSDPGYAYLGELLASRGFIAVSIDQNFLNGSAVGDILDMERLSNENDARAWLILQHLAQWQRWHNGANNPFAARVDLNNIGLIGHSRGGEAIAVATLFNSLGRYPENARVAFNFGFNIRAVAAIAPVDGQYLPGSRPTPLENVSYLVLQGSHDADVSSFAGIDQYARVNFPDGRPDWFKSAIYMYGANHGQFNSTWGSLDRTPPRGLLLERSELLSATDQEQAAAVFLSAFMETMLRGESDYRPFFQEASIGAAWLPATTYITQYSDPSYHYLATFEENVDVLTGTAPGVSMNATTLTTWRERAIHSKWGSRQDHAVYLGWDRERASQMPTFTLSMLSPPGSLSKDSVLLFSLADDREPEEDLAPLEFTVELSDRFGARVTSQFGEEQFLSPPLVVPLVKLGLFTDLEPAEPILASFRLPLADFTGDDAFQPEALSTIRLLFDRSPAGDVILDNIGWQ